MTSIPPLQTLTIAADALSWLVRTPPTAPDGTYDSEDQVDSGDDPANHSAVTNAIGDVEILAPKGQEDPDPLVIAGFMDAVVHPNAVDDRLGAFSAGLQLLAHLPPESAPAKQIEDSAIIMLYDTIPHPVATTLGPQHAFRQADGGGNNVINPDIGRAGMPYARTVQSHTPISPTALPDPGLVFDTLMCARDRQDHPGGNSSLTFAFATLVTHSLFRTDQSDWTVNATSSYLDLSPLYGINQTTQDLVRDKSQGRGLLYPDTFSEERLTFLPPAASALLVILNRNHNYIAQMLLHINERGTWSDPPPTDATALAKQDEEIFQIARLVKCLWPFQVSHRRRLCRWVFWGLQASLDLFDFPIFTLCQRAEGIVSPLLNDAFSPLDDSAGEPVSRGQGNQCSVEFNVLYRWHAVLSQADEQWTEQIFGKVFGTAKPFDQLTLSDFMTAFTSVMASIPTDPRQRTFGNLTRGADGRFADSDLARILQDATEAPAGAFRARGVPAVLRVMEILGITQARQWGVCTMNEFRAFLGLKTFADFSDWSSDPEIQNAARLLYGHIDNLELYVGIECEDTMPLKPEVRFSSGYTLMRAILSDALALVRGDRYFTTDYTPWNLTSWGFQDCFRDPHNGGLGGEMPKLLERHLPNYYPSNSVYSCFSFFTPTHMQTSLTAQGIAANYTFSRPVPTNPPYILNTLTAINYVFNNPASFTNMYNMKDLGFGYGFFLTFDDPSTHDPDRQWALNALFPSSDSLTQYRTWYRTAVTNFIQTRSWQYDGVTGNYIDVVKGVVNAAAVKWVTDCLCGITLKADATPLGIYTEYEMYEMLATLYTAIFLTIGDPEHQCSTESAAQQAATIMKALVGTTVVEVSPTSVLSPDAGLGTTTTSSGTTTTATSGTTTTSSGVNSGPSTGVTVNMLQGGLLGGLAGAATGAVTGAATTVASTAAAAASTATQAVGAASMPYFGFIQRLAASGRSARVMVATIIGLAVMSSVNFAQGAVHVLDFYLDDERAQECQQIIALVQQNTPDADNTLIAYIREGMRLNPQYCGLWRQCAVDASIPQGAGLDPINVKAGDRVWGSFKNAHINATDFPNPMQVDLTRPASAYATQNGTGFHVCPGVSLTELTMLEIVKAVFGLKNVRRAPGDAGRLAGFTQLVNETETKVYITPYGTTSAWPGSMNLVYDD
ncbi:Heme peroxidase [Mycena sanguinolenta]|uniref:Heme peroxidase n=1 Tax=Mycena sanguinolenta TaxID=230812 RepID=A0A8H6XP23_9AGAR|nr:Heme peroxidase [Mycena sanguinolenta]